jgi:hypothetical protein
MTEQQDGHEPLAAPGLEGRTKSGLNIDGAIARAGRERDGQVMMRLAG